MQTFMLRGQIQHSAIPLLLYSRGRREGKELKKKLTLKKVSHFTPTCSRVARLGYFGFIKNKKNIDHC